jgi:hypothetical protein
VLAAHVQRPLRHADRLTIRFSFDTVPEVLAARIERILKSDDPVSAAVSPKLRELVTLGRFLRDHGKLEELIAGTPAAFREGAEAVARQLAEENEAWQVRLRSMRMFCVSEIHDDLLMWAHYADWHRGAVVQFRCIPAGEGSALCAARQVQYQPDIPVVARTVEEWVAHMVGEHRLDLEGLFQRLILTKSTHWSYEKEWRCCSVTQIGDTNELAEPTELVPEEIAAVYLGCRMKPDDRDAIVNLIRQRLPHVQLFQARQSDSAFELEFDPIA